MIDLVAKGSETAKNGFKNEQDVIERFNNWKNDTISQAWLQSMGYLLNEIEYVIAHKVSGNFKADVQVQITITIKLKAIVDIQNLQVKLVSNPHGFNQIDKRWLSSYVELWNIPDDVLSLLKYFTGEFKPYILNPKDKRRMFMNEFTLDEQRKILEFIKSKQSLIVSDILKGRGRFAAEWMLVILNSKATGYKWVLKPMNYCLNLFGNGNVESTVRGSIKIGNITIQRKGGDGGRDTANMLQFKINPCLLFNFEEE